MDIRDSTIGGPAGRLADAARETLEHNWRGHHTVPSSALYPHQWSWDSAFIALGRSWYDQGRAQRELLRLFDAQWANGMVPHIVFDASVDDADYFPGPAFWDGTRSPHAPRHVATSGITQPPIHAGVALEMHRHAADTEASRDFLRQLYPHLEFQLRYLRHDRDPSGVGLPAIVHPWESGLDNSPVWDRDLRDLEIPEGALPSYQRRDLMRADSADRPRDAAYDRFVYLAVRYRDSGYDDRRLLDEVPFAIAGPLFSAIMLWSTHALAEIAAIVGADPAPHHAQAARLHQAVIDRLWDDAAGAYYPLDIIAGHREPEETIVSFVPLLDPQLPSAHVRAIAATLASKCFDSPFAVPTFDVSSEAFERRRYWRGPVWLNTNWLLWWGLRQHGLHEQASRVASSSLRLVEESGFREYYDPFESTGYGSSGFSWSAALTIDLVQRLGAEGVDEALRSSGAGH